MKKEIGLWIDHRKAVIVIIENEVDITREIRSNVEKNKQLSDSIPAKMSSISEGSTAEDMLDRKFGSQLGRYYEGITSFIRSADSIWIFGPGEAKIELENHLKYKELGARVVGVETVDKMTNQQIATKVRNHFLR
jgi:hypothetical protein